MKFHVFTKNPSQTQCARACARGRLRAVKIIAGVENSCIIIIIITGTVSSEISDFTPCGAHAQSNVLHIKYAEKTDYYGLGLSV